MFWLAAQALIVLAVALLALLVYLAFALPTLIRQKRCKHDGPKTSWAQYERCTLCGKEQPFWRKWK